MAYRKWDASGAIVLLGTIWFALTLAPSSSLVPLPDLMAEHRAYLPSVGFALALAGLLCWYVEHLQKSSLHRATLQAASGFVIVLLAGATLSRNEVYKDEETLYRDVMTKSPDKPRVWNTLGAALGRKGRLAEAVPCFEKAVALAPGVSMWQENLGTVLLSMGRYEEAVEATAKAIDNCYYSPRLFHNHGLALVQVGRYDEALTSLRKAIELAPMFRHSRLLLGCILAQYQQPKEAIEHYDIAMLFGPLSPDDMELYQKAKAEVGTTGTSALATAANAAEGSEADSGEQ